MSSDQKKTAKCNPPFQIFIKLGKMKDFCSWSQKTKLFQNWTRIDWVRTFQKLIFLWLLK